MMKIFTNITHDIHLMKNNIIDINCKLSKLNLKINQNSYLYTDVTKKHTLNIAENVKIIYITAIAGGGAGGIGFINGMYYYSGGGGGGGSCMVKKPIHVVEHTVININVGRGGSQMENIDGGDTIIEIIYPNNDKDVLCIAGGKNACPTKDIIINKNNYVNTSSNANSNLVLGGTGGISSTTALFNGDVGNNGNISVPSQPIPTAGDGGSTIMSNGGSGVGNISLLSQPLSTTGNRELNTTSNDNNIGNSSNYYLTGKGGNNYFNKGGRSGNIDHFTGEDGSYGSGGGGSYPRYNINFNNKLSGNGGNRIVIIETVQC